MSASEKPKTPLVVAIVIRSRARAIVDEFMDGENPRTLARKYGLSRTGVEDIIRANTRATATGRGRR